MVKTAISLIRGWLKRQLNPFISVYWPGEWFGEGRRTEA